MPANEKKSRDSETFQDIVDDLSVQSWSELAVYEQHLKSEKYCLSLYEHIKEGTVKARALRHYMPIDVYYDSLSRNEKAVFITAFFEGKTMAQYWEEQSKLNDVPTYVFAQHNPDKTCSHIHHPAPSAPPLPSYYDYLRTTPEKAAELLSNAFKYYNEVVKITIGISLNPLRSLRDDAFSKALALFKANPSPHTLLPIVELYLQASAPGCWSSLFGSSEPPRLLQAITPPLCEIFGTSKDHLRFHASRWVETQSSAAVNLSYA